jgi:hypothetical protein
MILYLLLYIPFFIALYVAIHDRYVATRNYQQVNPIWIPVLVASFFTGAAPLVAIFFLLTHKKVTDQPTEWTVTSEQNDPSKPASLQVIPQKHVRSTLGTVIVVVLWVSGLFIVGIFVLFALFMIQCANDPKCM